MHKRILTPLWALALLFHILIGQDIKAERATHEEMEMVSRNWLTYMVDQKGEWADDVRPQIVGVEEIVEGDTVLARCFHISPRGFVVVPILKELPPIKTYSDDCNLDLAQKTGFPQLLRDVLLHRIRQYVKIYGSLDAAQPPSGEVLLGREHRAEWDKFCRNEEEFQSDLTGGKMVALTEVGPLLTTAWHQSAPYNNDCPMGDGGRCIVGCVATAAAQIMRYYEWPPSGTGSHSYTWNGDQSCGGNVGGGTLSATFSDSYDWQNMPDDCGSGCTPAEQDALAELCYEVGVAFEMDYGRCGSGIYLSQIPDVMAAYHMYFRYDPSIDQEDRADYATADDWFSVIQTEINNGRPMQYFILRHSIVCDGWRDSGGQNQYHMNYGWGGGSTAWYSIDNLYCPWEPGGICPYDVEFMFRNIMTEGGFSPPTNLVAGDGYDAYVPLTWDPPQTYEVLTLRQMAAQEENGQPGDLQSQTPQKGLLNVNTGVIPSKPNGKRQTAELAYYNIYRSNYSGGGYSSIGTSPTTNYNDFSVVCGHTYYYVVTAVYSSPDGESEYSNEDAGSPLVHYYTISGYVQDSDLIGIDDVLMSLSGYSTATTYTEGGGYYFFGDLLCGQDYTITPSKACWTFDPASRDYNELNSNKYDQDFTGYLEHFSISGYIRDESSTPISGVSMVLSGDASASCTTLANGYYEFTDLAGCLDYTVTPNKPYWTFDPPSHSYQNLSVNHTNQNFTGYPEIYDICGYVRDSASSGIDSTMISLTGFAECTTYTDVSGYYCFFNLMGGENYMVTPSKPSWSFEPTSISYTPLTSNQENQNYLGTSIACLIAGSTNYYSGGQAIEGVDVILSIGANDTSSTNGSGYYEFTGLESGLDYLVTPLKVNQENGAIMMYDASLAARYSVGLVSLDSYQEIAADVDGNGQVQMYDASWIARFAVDLVSSFPIGSDWRFLPDYRYYDNLSNDYPNEDYIGILYGDVDGNWVNYLLFAKEPISEHNDRLVPAIMSSRSGEIIRIPITNDHNSEIYAIEFTLRYNPEVLRFVAVEKTELTRNFYFFENNLEGGELKIGGFGTEPIKSMGTLLYVCFEVNGNDGNTTSLSVDSFRFNASHRGRANCKLNVGIGSCPQGFSLNQNYPNPFNPKTTISFTLPKECHVELLLYDVTGRLVKTLFKGRREEGNHNEMLNVSEFPSGIYFYQLKTDNFVSTKKLIILK